LETNIKLYEIFYYICYYAAMHLVEVSLVEVSLWILPHLSLVCF